jgi:hypothetical protein
MTRLNSDTIPPLIGGGLMLTYRCSNNCKHCLYRCSTMHADEFMSEKRIDETFAALSRERSLYGMHIAGGEATLNWDRLLYAIRSAGRHGVGLEYLETNAHWCDDDETALAGFRELQAAGLNAVLISASMFHVEFIPLRKTKAAIRAAFEVFGRHNVLVWTPDVLQRMDQALEDDRTYPLRKSAPLMGLDIEHGEVFHLHTYLRSGGRAAERLADGLSHYSPDSFEGDRCGPTMDGVQHFHIDPFGNLFTGHCPGISIATIDDFHPTLDPEEHPFFFALKRGGPYSAWRECAPEFEPDSKGYTGKCHFCLELRKSVQEEGRFLELRPREYY